MVRHIIIYTFIAIAAIASATYAQVLHTQCFDPDFRTLKVAPRSNNYFPPIWVMGLYDDPLVVSFDHLSENHMYLRYSIVHCNSDWQPSELQESEYVSGFNYADIEQYDYSASTFAHYVHYQFAIPNSEMQILKSGNYIVKVYEQDSPDDVLLQARFSVCENTMAVRASVTSRTDIDYNEQHQQVSVEVKCKQGSVIDPYNDLKLIVSQNSRLDNEVTITHPLMVSGESIVYDHNRELIFPAGNEFRRIETVATHAPSMGVISMQYFDPYYHANLRLDIPRADEPYYYDRTQHGYFTIRNWESEHSDTEADYIVTHFSLDTNGKLNGGKIYLDGEFTEHKFIPKYEMRYDMSSGLYIADILLKQGAYNYQYLWMPDGENRGYTAAIEGDKYQTVNEYLARVYQRHPGDRYDRFVGFGIAFSGK